MRSMTFSAALLLALAAPAVFADGRCTGFKWDVSKEVALFDTASLALPAGKSAEASPAIEPDRLYGLQLQPQTEVTFAVTPGRSTARDGSFAGLALLTLKTPGNYRVAVDTPLWIDVVVKGQLATVTDYQGQQNCEGPHKIVEFDLAGATQFIVQLSGANAASIRLTVTKTPARAQ